MGLTAIKNTPDGIVLLGSGALQGVRTRADFYIPRLNTPCGGAVPTVAVGSLDSDPAPL